MSRAKLTSSIANTARPAGPMPTFAAALVRKPRPYRTLVRVATFVAPRAATRPMLRDILCTALRVILAPCLLAAYAPPTTFEKPYDTATLYRMLSVIFMAF